MRITMIQLQVLATNKLLYEYECLRVQLCM